MFDPIPIDEFLARVRLAVLPHTTGECSEVVSLRQLASIESVQPMRRDYLRAVMCAVPLADGRGDVYKHARITTLRVDPHAVRLGQTFVERSKYQQFLEGFEASFGAFCVARGMAKLGACIAYGKTQTGVSAIAHYVPPIVECGPSGWVLLDGVHRMYLAKQIGTTLETVIVEPVTARFPTDLHEWDQVRVVNTKPPREERYNNLRPELFRNLKYVGLDG
ncbi:MAG: hypothetical protein AAB421_04420 [Patescibacteria group bacterium]